MIVCSKYCFIICCYMQKSYYIQKRFIYKIILHTLLAKVITWLPHLRVKKREVSLAYSYPFVRYERTLSQMNKFSNSAGKLYALSAGESKPSTVTVLHLLPACYSLRCVNAPRSSHRIKTPFCAIALYRS